MDTSSPKIYTEFLPINRADMEHVRKPHDCTGSGGKVEYDLNNR